MTTLIVSDVHLGSSFNKVRELSAFIKSVSFSRLIILGYLFDKPSIKGLRDEEWEFLDIVKGMSRRREIIWVEGNHDEGLYDASPSLLNKLAVKEYEWTVKGKRTLQFTAINSSGFQGTGLSSLPVPGDFTGFYEG